MSSAPSLLVGWPIRWRQDRPSWHRLLVMRVLASRRKYSGGSSECLAPIAMFRHSRTPVDGNGRPSTIWFVPMRSVACQNRFQLTSDDIVDIHARPQGSLRTAEVLAHELVTQRVHAEVTPIYNVPILVASL